jgi:lipopolysaccharide transport system permease protein
MRPHSAQPSSNPMGRWLPLLTELVRREITGRYLGTFSGAIWALVHPLLQLAIYGYVFIFIFRTRLPEAEFGSLGFLPFLAIGLWPWNAFAEAVNRSATTIPDAAGLLGKVALPRPLLVVAPICASFLLATVGLVAVVALLWTGGWLRPTPSALLMMPLMVLLMIFATGVGWFVAALNVFVRDIGQALPQLTMLLFFLTPVLYPRSLIPESIRVLADANPLALYVGLFRQCIMGVGHYGFGHAAIAAAIALATAAAGYLVFRRLAPHFEDFL